MFQFSLIVLYLNGNDFQAVFKFSSNIYKIYSTNIISKFGNSEITGILLCLQIFFRDGNCFKKKKNTKNTNNNGTKIMSLLFILNRRSIFFCRVEMVDVNYP